MKLDFWHERWAQNQTGWHEGDANLMLVAHLPELSLSQGARVFVPLCGKTNDIGWLLSKGYCVAGAELSETAIEQLFADLGVEPEIKEAGELKCYSADSIDIFVGDFFKLSKDMLGDVDAVYDRAALVAMPESMRDQYALHLTGLTNKAPHLLVCFEYDQSLMDGPPFSVNREEVERIYEDRFKIKFIQKTQFPGKLKGICDADEVCWLLS